MSAMNKYNIFLQATAYADNELTDGPEIATLTRIIETDPDVRREYLTQIRMKRLAAKLKYTATTPDAVRDRIMRSTVKKNKFSLPETIFYQPAYIVSFVVVGILLLIGLSLSANTGHITFSESGADNMVVQAGMNFSRITSGKLAPQLVTNDPDAMKQYFRENGVDYDTYIPKLSGWKMLGCVVSDEHGIKMAHHVYVNGDGKILYVFQAASKYFARNKALTISSPLLRYISGGRYYLASCGGYNTAVLKVGENICTMVSDESPEKLKPGIDSYLTLNRKL